MRNNQVNGKTREAGMVRQSARQPAPTHPGHRQPALIAWWCLCCVLSGLCLADAPILVIDPGGHKAKLSGVMFTRDGRYLVSTSVDKTVRVWDVGTGDTVRVLRGQIGPGSEGKIYAAALSPRDRLLAVGGYSEHDEIRLIDFRTGEVTALLKGHTNVISALAFSPDGTRLISGSFDKTARIWAIGSRQSAIGNPECLCVLRGHTDYIYAVARSPDGTRAATGSDDDALKLWDARSGRLIKTLTGHTNDVVSVAFTPDGRYLLSGSWDRTIRLWDGRTGAFIKALARQDSNVDSLSISPDGSKVLTGCGYGTKTNNVFAIPSGERVASFTKHDNIVLATAISPDGKTAATGGGNDREIYLWDLATGEVKRKLVGKGRSVWSVGFARDGKGIAWGKTFHRSDQSMYQLRGSLEQTFQLKGEGRAFELKLGPEVRSALRGGEGDPLKRVTTNQWLRALESVGPWTLRTQNGKMHPTLEILRNGKVIHQITWDSTTGYRHNCFALTPDGQTVISGGACLTSYDPRTGRELRQFVGHTGDLWAVAASPDSGFLVSGSADQTVRLWSIPAGKPLLTIFHASDGEWVAWTPEGYYTASLKGDQYIGWHINQGEDRAALYYPASRFSNQFYSPEITARYVETDGDLGRAIQLVNAARPRPKQVTKTAVADLQQLLPPAVFFQIPSERDVTVAEPRIRVKAQARSLTKEPIQDLWLLVNGSRLDKARGFGGVAAAPQKKAGGLRAELDVTVPLTQAVNRISVLASNRHARSEPETINITWKKRGAAKELYKPDLYLLSIGVSRYEDPNWNLGFARADAEGIAAALRKQQGKLYGRVHTKVLADQDANGDNVLDGLDWLLKQSTQKDVSVLFVAGHGLKDERGNYHFLPHDGNPARLRRTGVKWFDFQDVLTSLPSKTIFMIDTCHSGGVTGKRRGGSDMTDALRELLQAGTGVVVLTAATAKEFSVEREDWGHGAFTKATLEGLEGKADYDGDSIIDIKELDLYITKRVKQLTNGAQHPTTEIPKTMPNFPLACQ